MLKLPDKLDNCPIKEAIFEIRFESAVPGAAVFGMAYSVLKPRYPKSEPLPVVQLPEAVRDADPNLSFQPHYRLTQEHFVVQIGPKVLSINVMNPYCGWTAYRQEILSVYREVE